MLKLQSPSTYSPFDEIHLSRCFLHCSKQFLNLSILVPFSASAVFCFTSSTSAKHFLLRNCFIWGNKKSLSKSSMEILQKIKNGSAFQPSYPTSGNISEGTQNSNSKEHKPPYVHCSVIYNHQDKEAAQVPISR